MDFRHLIVTCLFSKLRLPFDNQKVKENYAIFLYKMEETQETTGFQPFALSPKDLTYYWSATEKGGDSKDAWSMRLYADDKMTGYGLNTGYSDKEKKEYYLRCIRDIP